MGTFGPHGPELLQVSRQMEGGREWAVATKLTGDPNVPAGSVSWKAVIGKSNRLPGEQGQGMHSGSSARPGSMLPGSAPAAFLLCAPLAADQSLPALPCFTSCLVCSGDVPC